MNYSSHPACPFCDAEAERRSVARTSLAFALRDRYPVSLGHTLIIPVRHVADFFALTAEERDACLSLLDEMKAALDREFSPDGYNVGINVGAAAGQTVPHVHFHLIPRYAGDLPDPRGGVRGVIPERQKYGG